MVKKAYPTIPIDEALAIDVEDDVININRSVAVVKGGRRFSFSALAVVGNRDGCVGIGYGKAKEVPSAVEKSVKNGRKRLMHVIRDGQSIPHQVEGRFCSSRVRLIPASPGTGIIAGKAVRKVVELAGIRDILTKTYGSTNSLNVVKATMDALSKLRDKKQIEELRGVKIGMNLSEAKAQGLAYTRANRIGRGTGSGNGKTAGRGHKGAKARSGWSRRLAWEGGQMPLFRRVPKRGFNNKNFKKFYTTTNVSQLNGFGAGAVVDLDAVLAAGLVSKTKHSNLFKILGDGEISVNLTVKVDAITSAARGKIEAAGGSVELIPQVAHRPKFEKKNQTKQPGQNAAE